MRGDLDAAEILRVANIRLDKGLKPARKAAGQFHQSASHSSLPSVSNCLSKSWIADPLHLQDLFGSGCFCRLRLPLRRRNALPEYPRLPDRYLTSECAELSPSCQRAKKNDFLGSKFYA